MNKADSLLSMLRLDALPDARFGSRHAVANINGRIFGGQMLGQALWAAGQAVDGRTPAQLHYMFGSGAGLDSALTYTVENLQQGRRFSTRRVCAHQAGRIVGSGTASFQLPIEGLRHQAAFPAVPEPETLPDTAAMRETLAKHPGARYLLSHRMMWVDIRPIGFEALMAPTPDAHLRYWVRFQAPLPDEPLLHCAALTFISDLWLAGIGVAPHRGLGEAQQYYFAALSHSIWFHRPFRADDWLLFDATSPAAGNGQGLSEAKIFDRAGMQVATVVQSALITEMQPGHSGDAQPAE